VHRSIPPGTGNQENDIPRVTPGIFLEIFNSPVLVTGIFLGLCKTKDLFESWYEIQLLLQISVTIVFLVPFYFFFVKIYKNLLNTTRKFQVVIFLGIRFIIYGRTRNWFAESKVMNGLLWEYIKFRWENLNEIFKIGIFFYLKLNENAIYSEKCIYIGNSEFRNIRHVFLTDLNYLSTWEPSQG